MSRTGNCYDNAVAEPFFWSLKYEWTNHRVYDDLESAWQSVFNYIEIFYNQKRGHQTLAWISPVTSKPISTNASRSQWK